MFDNHEEVDCYPVYRDPVHDFGILRYDPKAIKYMHVDGLELRPDLAKGKICSPPLACERSQANRPVQSVSRSESSVTMQAKNSVFSLASSADSTETPPNTEKDIAISIPATTKPMLLPAEEVLAVRS